MKTLLITGGCGFIGSNFIHYMLKKYPDYTLVNLDSLTYAGNRDNLKNVEKNPHYTFVKGDIGDINLVTKLFEKHKIDAVVNFAAESHVDNSITGGAVFVETNVLKTFNLLKVAHQHNVEKFLHISTDEVYGSIDEGHFTETDILDPSSPYSASKASAEMFVKSFYTTFDLPVLITRSSNNFGPYQHPEKLIPKFITNAIKGEKLPLMGDGLNVRDWLYVKDNCAGLDLVLHKGKVNELYNLGAGNEKTNKYITYKILEHLGKDDSLIEWVPDRLGHDRRYAITVDKIKSLGWRPKQDFDKSLEYTVQWYKENQWWWEKLVK